MTSIERIGNILKRKSVDRIGVYEHFWDDTIKSYMDNGKLESVNSINEYLDMQENWSFKMIADLDHVDKIISENEETVTIMDGNGATLRRHKLHDTTPEHVNFKVKTREEWEPYKLLLKQIDSRRINFEAYRKTKEYARKNNKFFVWSGVNVFECIHPIAGHENMLMGMALDPEWFLDMAETYTELTLALQEILFEKEGKPDGIWYYEDMGFKGRPFVSPAMYKEMIQPYHKRTIDYAHSLNLPVIMHSCGFVEPLLPHILEAGIDCLQVIEIKAGMDLLRIHKNYGDKLSLMGGIDVRTLYSNDKTIIDKELESKIPVVKNGFGYVLHSDHSIPASVNFETLQYFFEKGLELGTY